MSSDTRSLAVVLAALAWVALLVTTPVLPSVFAAAMYGMCSFLCHQMPERSFYLGSVQLPVCARCLGIYAGFAAAAIVYVMPRLRACPGRDLTASSARWIFIVGALPTGATVALEWSRVWPATNEVRAIAGSTLGIGLAIVVMGALATLHYSACAPRRPTAPNQSPPRI